MTRFLLCSFALVLLYPSGIDMYLVGLPRIAQVCIICRINTAHTNQKVQQQISNNHQTN